MNHFINLILGLLMYVHDWHRGYTDLSCLCHWGFIYLCIYLFIYLFDQASTQLKAGLVHWKYNWDHTIYPDNTFMIFAMMAKNNFLSKFNHKNHAAARTYMTLSWSTDQVWPKIISGQIHPTKHTGTRMDVSSLLLFFFFYYYYFLFNFFKGHSRVIFEA